MPAQSVWLVTGCSTGFGEEFIKQILARGDKAISTARNPNSMRTNTFGCTSMLRAMMPHWQRQKSGSLLVNGLIMSMCATMQGIVRLLRRRKGGARPYVSVPASSTKPSSSTPARFRTDVTQPAKFALPQDSANLPADYYADFTPHHMHGNTAGRHEERRAGVY
ncbi:hypothetical protein LTR36_000009 [Oleoguttula mirabilis]|uniref:Uncharacterized protein n=1 Tax=Oleoguttula mirabilis TaxID=1507867 RepID=A0AAV9JZA4_9PEZI|nr:hypothetical protein LTR36_000009 [Oleoguttula mirabilis]